MRRLIRLGVVALAVAALPALFAVDLAVGAYKMSPAEVFSALAGLAPGTAALVVWQLRLPQVLASLILGASLASAGAVLQVITRNHLASTFTLGVSAAAGFGAALAIIFGAGYVKARMTVVTEPELVILSAFLFASAASALVYFLSFIKGASPTAIILAGVAVMFMFSTGTSLLQYLSANPEATHAVVMWMLGSVTNVTLDYIPFMALSLLALPYFLLVGWRLDALHFEDETAHSLGLDVKKLRLTIMALTSFQAATVISFVGIVGFVDLVVPNIAKMLVGVKTRAVVALSALIGADLTLAADILSKSMIPPYVMPIGTVLALIGAPYLLVVLLTRYRYE